MKALLEYRTDVNVNEGWAEKGSDPERVWSTNNPIQLCHDIFEHLNGHIKIGGYFDEHEAFGAMWFIRGRHGVLDVHNSYSEYTEQDFLQEVAVNTAYQLSDNVVGKDNYKLFPANKVSKCLPYQPDYVTNVVADNIAYKENSEFTDKSRIYEEVEKVYLAMYHGYKAAELKYKRCDPFSLFMDSSFVIREVMEEAEEFECYIELKYDLCDKKPAEAKIVY